MTLPDGWREILLGELVDILDGRRVPVSAAERSRRPGDVPYYGAAGRVGFIDRALFNEDLVLLGEDGVQFFDPVRSKAYRITGPSWVNNHAHVLRARPAIDWRYLTYFLNQVDYHGYANGTTRLKLTQGAMREIRVALPPLDEQRRIIEILEKHLSTLDSASKALRSTRLRLIALRRTVISNTFRADEAPRPLADLLSYSIGGLWGAAPGADEIDVDVYRVTELQEFGRLRPSQTRRAITRKQFDSRQLQLGDLLLEKSGGGPTTPVGRVGLVDDDSTKSVCANFMQLMRPRADTVRPQYLHILLNDFHDRGGTRSLQKASTNIRNIKASEYLHIPFAIPAIAEQDAAIAAVDLVTHQILRIRSEVDAAFARSRGLRRALLQAAFSGQLTGRSSDLDRAEELVS